jgi:hypothetical protein
MGAKYTWAGKGRGKSEKKSRKQELRRTKRNVV